MRILAVSVLLGLGLAACEVEHKVTLSSEECERLKGEDREACLTRLSEAIAKVSEQVEDSAEKMARAAKELEAAGEDVGQRMERVGEAMRSPEPAPPAAPRP